MAINSYSQLLDYFFHRVPRGTKRLFPGELGLRSAKHLMELLGNPQNQLKVIHVAGTSGKGSTAFIMSSILSDIGFKVGLHLSPYLIDFRESFLVNNRYPAKNLIVSEFSQMLKRLRNFNAQTYGPPTYFELKVALAYWLFAKERVDYAVMETGLGGLLDATNTVVREDKIAVITRIGLDHTRVLGSKLSQIAAQKGGIIGFHNQAFSTVKRRIVREVLNQIASNNSTSIMYIENGTHFKQNMNTERGSVFDFRFQNAVLKKLSLSLIGPHQVENASLALGVCYALSARDGFGFDEKVIKHTLSRLHFKGRMDIKKVRGKTIILDAAHNPQKMKSLVLSLRQLYPGRRYNFVVAFKRGKNYPKMLDQLLPLAQKISIGRFFSSDRLLNQLSIDPMLVESYLVSKRLKSTRIIKNKSELRQAVIADSQSITVVTGSLYFLSEIYPLLDS